ncbi:MAG: NAD-dependent epimerase/dehydratase family protein [Candidatus Limnocylindrales bacterium]
MILYNGASGGLGRYLAGPLSGLDEPSHALTARLDDQFELAAELSHLDPHGAVTFIHLAARVSVPACESDPSGAYNTNVLLARATVATVLEWASRRGAIARVIYLSSGHVYAAQPDGFRVAEDAPTLPRSVYAQTKLAAEQELRSLASTRDMPFLVARVFGLLAPRQAPNYVLPALIERARTGDLDGIPGLDFARDYLDARDVCQDLLLLAAAPWLDTSLVVNVCSGVAVTIRELLRAVLGEVDPKGATDAARRATAAPGRPDDVRWLVGDPSAFSRLTGYLPQRIPLSRTVADAVGAVG